MRIISSILVLSLAAFLTGGCGGGGSSGTGSAQPAAKLEATGIVDVNFGQQGVAYFIPPFQYSPVIALDEYADGSLITGGEFGWISKVTVDGKVDPAFGNAGVVQVERGAHDIQLFSKLHVLPNQTLLAVEHDFMSVSCFSCLPDRWVVRRLGASGEVDLTYGENGQRVLSGAALDISLSGRVAVSTITGGVGQLDPGGTVDTAFESNAAKALDCSALLPGDTWTTAVTFSGEKLIVGRLIAAADPTVSLCVARLNEDGTVDTTFGNSGRQVLPGVIPKIGRKVYALRILVRKDGEVLLFLLPDPNAQLYPALRYLRPNGEIDTELNGSNSPVFIPPTTYDVAIQENGKVLAVGLDKSSPQLVRSVNGMGYDPLFGPDHSGVAVTSSANQVLIPYSVLVARDGSIVVGGRSNSTTVPIRSALMRFR